MMKNFYIFNVIINIAILTIAAVSQWYFNLILCKMCDYQRYLYLMVIIASSLALFRWNKVYRFILIVLYMAALWIAITQLLSEAGLIAPISFCDAVNIGDKNDIESFKNAIINNERVSCNGRSISLLGLSFAAYSAMFAAIMVIFTIIIKNKE